MKFALQHLKAIPRSIWALGFVSMFMDISSEMIHALLPAYLVTVLGANMALVGFIEGLTEITAAFLKLFSGMVSDYIGKRKLLVALGYGLAAFSKALFPFANSVATIIAARLIDRVGKGVREAPRDALIADITPAPLRGAAYGLRQALDTLGAVVGPLIAIVAMIAVGNQFLTVFWLAVIPAAIAVLLVVFGVQEPAHDAQTKRAAKISFLHLKELGFNYWWLLGVSVIATFARFSDVFLILRAQHDGFSLAWVPVVLVVMNSVYALAVYPIGYLSDFMNRSTLLVAGFAVLFVSQLVLAYAVTVVGALIGVVLWGLQMGMTQGLFAAMIADAVPATVRGTAFGIFNAALGVALLASNLTAGMLWDAFGPQGTFLVGAFFSVVALVGIVVRRSNYAVVAPD